MSAGYKVTQGQLVGRDYQILEEVGHGGMGVVFKAKQLSTNRIVCVKVPLFGADKAARLALDAEAQKLARCNHPNVVTVYQGARPDEEPFIAMEWMDCQTLRHLVNGGHRFSELDVLRVAQGVLSALQYMHAHSAMVHCDIKPDNIFFSEAIVKLADFGLAIIRNSMPTANPPRRWFGTPQYMAPELFDAGAEGTVLSDQYALGCTMHEMLTGEIAFHEDKSKGRPWKEFHLQHRPEMNVEKTCPVRLHEILARMMAPEASRRYRSHAECLKDVEELRDELLGEEPDVLWFLERQEATSEMRERMSQMPKITLVGVSHERLAGLVIQSLELRDVLPWQSIRVVFGDTESGIGWEGANFLDNIRRHRREIAIAMTGPGYSDRLKHLQCVEFYLGMSPTAWMGALMEDGERGSSVAYVVLAGMKRDGGLEKAATFRIVSKNMVGSRHASLLATIVDEHRTIVASSRRLGAFHRNVWDLSAHQWKAYCDHGKAYRASVECLARLIDPNPKDSILDVGCGAGALALKLMEQCAAPVEITLLDSSPQMLRVCEDALRSRRAKRVSYALCHVPAPDPHEVEIDLVDDRLERRTFSKIVLHLMLPSLCPDSDGVARDDQLAQIAGWCAQHVSENGFVYVTARNTTVETAQTASWSGWEDRFRSALRQVLERQVVSKNHLRLQSGAPLLKSDMVVDVMQRYGFELHSMKQVPHPLMMDERRLMWECPAILDTMVDVRSIGVETGKQLVDLAFHEGNQPMTRPMIVTYWVFQHTDP